MNILKIKNTQTGEWQEIAALVGPAGADGYTPIKGVDYFDGQDGIQGPVGPAGYTPIKGVDYFDGYTPIKGTDYFDGEPGPAGYTPVKGTDYYTEADKQEMVQLVLNAIVDGNEVSY